MLISEGNTHDIAHFMKVYAYARTIGECEGLDADTQTTLEVAVVVHDIACPLCREKYGNTDGPNQEKEGAAALCLWESLLIRYKRRRREERSFFRHGSQSFWLRV